MRPTVESARAATTRVGPFRVGRCFAALVLVVAGCTSPGPEGTYKVGQPYQIGGRWYYPSYDPDYDEVGTASWYGPGFHGRQTANGEMFDRHQISAAHPTLPLPSIVRVTNLSNRRELEVRVNDRGPFIGRRIIDLSQAAARELGFERQGTARVRVEFVRLAEARGRPPRPARAIASVAPPRPATPGVVLASDNRCSGQFIQIGAFADAERAMRVVTALHAMTQTPVVTQRPAGDRLVRVRLGPIADPDAAAATLSQIKRSGYQEAFLVPAVMTHAAPC